MTNAKENDLNGTQSITEKTKPSDLRRDGLPPETSRYRADGLPKDLGGFRGTQGSASDDLRAYKRYLCKNVFGMDMGS